MKNEQRGKTQDGAFAPSRRDFLKLAGFGGATLVGAGALSTATACSTTNDSKNATTTDQASDNKGTMPIETYEPTCSSSAQETAQPQRPSRP